jgi:hypothetical protein
MANISKQYIRALSTIIQLFVGLYLAVRFFPYKKHKIDNSDAAVIFGCAVFLLTNVGFTESILRTFEHGFGLPKTVDLPQKVNEENPLADTINLLRSGGGGAPGSAGPIH